MVRSDSRHLILFTVATWSSSGFFFLDSEMVDITLFNLRLKLSNSRSFLVRQRELLCGSMRATCFLGEKGRKQ